MGVRIVRFCCLDMHCILLFDAFNGGNSFQLHSIHHLFCFSIHQHKEYYMRLKSKPWRRIKHETASQASVRSRCRWD